MSDADGAYFLLYVSDTIVFVVYSLSLFLGNIRQSFKLLILKNILNINLSQFYMAAILETSLL